MGTVYRATYTKPIPNGAEIFTKSGKRFARWKNSKGRKQVSPVTTGKDGTDRLIVESPIYVAKYRDGSGHVCKVSTGCRDEDAARSVLGKLERRAELVKAEVISTGEAATADHQQTPIADHFAAYVNHVRAKGATGAHIADLKRKAERLFAECFTSLRDIDAEKLESWLNDRQAEKMSARTRNAYLQAIRGFCKWCVPARLASNPLTRIAKADEKCDRRRQRRAMTEAELVKLLEVARLRPLAEFGRTTTRPNEDKAEADDSTPKRANWRKAVLTLDTMSAVVERARARLADNPEFVAKLERLGRERALIYKTLLLTGLRKGELASLTVGQLEFDGPMPFIVLEAADEKNREGSTIPLRLDLANDLKEWLSNDTPNAATLRLQDHDAMPDSKRPLFTVPAGLVRILDRDLLAAGIKKRDERGRTIDVHALRHSFGTLLSKAGVAPRTAQAAMRHSKIDLTMNVYTDPKLLDVQGALDALPSLEWKSSPSTERAVVRATGTDHQDRTLKRDRMSSALVPLLVPNTGKRGESVSLAVHPSNIDDERVATRTVRENRKKPSKKASPAVFADKALKVEDSGIEPLTSCMPCKRSPS